MKFSDCIILEHEYKTHILKILQLYGPKASGKFCRNPQIFFQRIVKICMKKFNILCTTYVNKKQSDFTHKTHEIYLV